MVGKSHVNIRLPVFSHLLWGNSLLKHGSEPMGLLWSIGWVSMASLLPSGNGGSGFPLGMGTGLNPGFPMGTCSQHRELGMSQAKTSDADLGKHLREGTGKVPRGTGGWQGGC